MENKYKYFVSFWWRNDYQSGYGNAEFPTNRKINKYEDIEKIEQYIEEGKSDKTSVYVLNYQLIE